MILEQRIGRIDRIGQKKSNIYIYNFVVDGSIDARIIATLGRKLGLIEGSILEPSTVLPSIETPKFGSLESEDLELELQKAHDLVRAMELSTQVIPDDYDLARAISRASFVMCIPWRRSPHPLQTMLSETIAPNSWRRQMSSCVPNSRKLLSIIPSDWPIEHPTEFIARIVTQTTVAGGYSSPSTPRSLA
jgi:hypothetical protein